MVIYNFLRVCIRGFYKACYFSKAYGLENIPTSGPMLIASNHISMGDPIMVAVYTRRRKIHFMAKKELWNNKLVGKIVSALGAFPVDRSGNDLGAVKTAVRLLRDGHVMCIFPEGTRNKKDGRIEKIHTGAAAIAMRSDAPIIPVAITGKHKFFGKTTLSVGKPIDLSKYKANPDRRAAEKELTERIKADINALWDSRNA